MKIVQKYQTRDGSLFDSLNEATNYAENQLDLAITAMAHRLLKLPVKYVDMLGYVEKNHVELHQLFGEINALKKDTFRDLDEDEEE